MKRISIILLAILTASTMTAHAADTAKLGQSCKKLGQVQTLGKTKLVCIQKGGKKIWSKPVVTSNQNSTASIPTPVASQTPAPVSFEPMKPWATDSSRDLLVKSAVYAMNTKKSGSAAPYEVTYQDGIYPEDKASIEKLLSATFALFGSATDTKVQVIVGISDEWAARTAKAKSLFLITPDYPCGVDHPRWDVACAEPGQVIIILSQSYKTRSNGQTPLRLGEQSFAPHETFHTLQFGKIGRTTGLPPTDPMYIPRWLLEGSANFIGYYMQERVGIRSYEEGRAFQVDDNPSYFDDRGLLPLKDYEVPSLSSKYLDPYGIGQAATEYLVASAGPDVILKIFEFTAADKSFSSGFKRATGISLEDFYSKFELARKTMKIGKH